MPAELIRHQSILSAIKDKPQLVSLLLLVGIAGLTILLKFLIRYFYNIEVPTIYQLIFIGVSAAGLSYWINLPRWWCWINGFFPICVGLFNTFNWSSSFYLLGFVLLVIIYWNTFATRVPYYPSNQVVWQELLELMPNNKNLNILEVGSGFGGCCLYLKKMRPNDQVVGVELAPIIWLYSYLRGHLLKSQCQFLRKDYRKMDLSNQDLIFAFLSPAAMPALYRQSKKQLKTGAILASYCFEIPCPASEGVEVIQISYGKNLYIWRQS